MELNEIIIELRENTIDINIEGLKEKCKSQMDRDLLGFVEAEEGMYTYLLPYNLENRISNNRDINFNSLKNIKNKGIYLVVEFLRIIMVRTNKEGVFSNYIGKIDEALNEALGENNEEILLNLSLEINKLLDISLEFFIGLSNYFSNRYSLATENKHYDQKVDINILEKSSMEGYHDFNIIGYFKEDEVGFYEMIIKNLESDFKKDDLKESLSKMENKGTLLVAGLFDAFLFNLRKKDRKFAPLYEIINKANRDFIEGNISEYLFNIIVGYIVMGLRYSFEFYICLKEYLDGKYK